MVSLGRLDVDMSRSCVPDVSPRPPLHGSLLRVLAHSGHTGGLDSQRDGHGRGGEHWGDAESIGQVREREADTREIRNYRSLSGFRLHQLRFSLRGVSDEPFERAVDRVDAQGGPLCEFFDLVFRFFDYSGVPSSLAFAGSELTRFPSAWF